MDEGMISPIEPYTPGSAAKFSPGLKLRVGDLVIRSHRLLKTRGTVIRMGISRSRGTQRVWVKWDHPHTLPNPSLEQSDTLDGITDPSTRPDG
jgi:hypothetical protein